MGGVGARPPTCKADDAPSHPGDTGSDLFSPTPGVLAAQRVGAFLRGRRAAAVRRPGGGGVGPPRFVSSGQKNSVSRLGEYQSGPRIDLVAEAVEDPGKRRLDRAGQALDLKRSGADRVAAEGARRHDHSAGLPQRRRLHCAQPGGLPEPCPGRDLALGLDRRRGGGGDQPAGPRLGAQRRRPGRAADRPARPRPHRGRGRRARWRWWPLPVPPARPSAPPTSSPAAMSPTPRRAAA